ncbi:MAG: hypothetical protein PHI11_10460 [Gallionella sp.]|nr:hypothetical protein [Gallionella sp.]
MSIYTLDEEKLHNLTVEIEAISPRPHHSALLGIANRIRPDCDFSYALNRGGWYRPGGVITAKGEPVMANLETWAKAELADCHGDMGELVERYFDTGLLVTRHTGRTHYFVAAYGKAPADFMQLEVEELQEVLDRQLMDATRPPEDLQELLEPIAPVILDAQAVAAPRYRFRRLLDMRQVIARVSVTEGGGLPRLLYEWGHSNTRGHFSDHWIVALREYQDRYRNPAVSAQLVSRHTRELKSFQWNTSLTGVALSEQLRAFGRAAGYPAAWYFHLVAGTLTPSKIAYNLAQDLDNGFSYLTDAEVGLLRGWISAPYSV